MKHHFLLTLTLIVLGNTAAVAQDYKFDFTPGKKAKEGYIKIEAGNRYNQETNYGYDFLPSPDGKENKAFFFSVTVPDGNYHITAVVGSKKKAAETTIRGESRRLFYNNIKTKKGEYKSCSFVINKRNPQISEKERVKLKKRELSKLNWDNKLTIEINGDEPQLAELIIERTESVPTLFLCGNSTVVDQDNEPWASWGQMITCFLNDKVCVANYAESGESANTFIGAGRLKKALSQMKEGDYLFVEFGHNDQKQTGPGKGAYYSFAYSIKQYIDEAHAKGAHPVLVTPTRRRHFDTDHRTILDTHGDFPKAVREIAARENVPLIELQELTKALYEAFGEDESKKAFVHYPAGTFRGQTNELADNTHFNTFGAYEVAKCVIEGIRKAIPELTPYIKEGPVFNPAHPDNPDEFHWNLSPFSEIEKPDGN